MKMLIEKIYKRAETQYLLNMSIAFAVYILVLLIVLNFIEIKAVSDLLDTETALWPLFFRGSIADITGVARLLMIPIALSFIIPNAGVCKWITRILIYVLYLFIFMVVLGASLFFAKALVPLDHSIFSYSIQEILYTIQASGLDISTNILLVIFVSLLFASLIFLRFSKKTIGVMVIVLVILSLLYPLAKNRVREENNFLIKNLTRCKSDYLLDKVLIYLQKPQIEKTEKSPVVLSNYVKDRIKDGFIQDTIQLKALSKVALTDYPLLHQSTYNPLSPYFKTFSKKPNIVFLIVESLDARVFKDFEEQKIVIAPFLNQLKHKSLYWNNFYSSTARTFGVLPAVLGSLPMGHTGFNDVSPTPLHKTIVSILKANHYQTNFFYGGWVGFQGMENFLLYQNIDHIYTHYPQEYQYKGTDFNWGVQDHFVFKRSIEVLDSINKSPFLNIYLTLATHSPFHLPQKEQLAHQLEKLNSHLDAATLKNITTDKYLSILYLDNSIQQIIEDYKAKGWFDNTIFIITGDHCMHELGKSNTLQTYAVPLLIYSPLLQRPQTFYRPASHIDITPSLLNLLKDKNGIHIDNIAHWLGMGLDTAKVKRRNTFIPFMNNNKDIVSCLFNDYFYTEETLYKIGHNNALVPANDTALEQIVTQRLQTYNYVNKYVVDNNNLMPLQYFADKNKPYIVSSYNEDNINLDKGENWQYETIKLDKDYKRLLFEYKVSMSFKDTLDNPKFGIQIYDDNDKYLDYFFFYNLSYVNSKYNANQLNKYKISRTIYNSKLDIFKKGNTIKFSVIDNKKEVEIKDLEVKVFSY